MSKITLERIYRLIALLVAILVIILFAMGSRLVMINLLSRSDSFLTHVAYILFLLFAFTIIGGLGKTIYSSFKRALTKKRNG